MFCSYPYYVLFLASQSKREKHATVRAQNSDNLECMFLRNDNLRSVVSHLCENSSLLMGIVSETDMPEVITETPSSTKKGRTAVT
jgi:hypothetical protein